MVRVGFDGFCDDIVFEQSAPGRMGEELLVVPNAEQVADHAGVVKVEFRAFNDTLVEVVVVGA